MTKEKKKFYHYVNQSSGKNNFECKEIMLYAAWVNCFPTKEKATAHFEEAYKIALEKYKQIKEGIQKIKDTVGNFSYTYFMEGDTHGIDDEGMYILITVNDYDFEFTEEFDN